MVPRRPGHISSKATASPRDGQRRATSPVELCRRRREALQRPAMLLPASTGRPLEKTTQKARFQPTHCSRALRGGSSPSKQREPARFHSVIRELSDLCPVLSDHVRCSVRSVSDSVSDNVRKSMSGGVRYVRYCPVECPKCPTRAQHNTPEYTFGPR